ncbi:MAG: hypothetical protein LUE63_08915 [Lachnospiraceae bacterium]|nr:hypothetical protein [Lachnospiraceae bacterium]
MENRSGTTFHVDEGLPVDEKMIESYLRTLVSAGKSTETVSTYRRRLRQMYQMLPEDKTVRRGTLEEIRETMQDMNYSVQSQNGLRVAANGFLEYYGRRELQIPFGLRVPEEARPELTRDEYLRLLSAARRNGKHRLYLLIKLFALTGATPAQLPLVTIEAVRQGGVREAACTLRFPPSLAEEFLTYAAQESVRTGAIFVTRSGRNIDRTNITREIRGLAEEAHISSEKCNPRALHRLYLNTQAGIREKMERLAEQENDRILVKEEQIIGWAEEVKE